MKGLIKGLETRKMKLLNRNIIQQAYIDTLQCKFCDSINIVRYGLTAKGKQRFKCQKCKRTFVIADAPEGAHYSYDIIASAINQFYEASSLHKIKRQIELDYGVSPSHMTIYRWITRYSKKASKELNNLPLSSRGTWVADETVLKLKSDKGQNIWFWDVIDDDTKFLLASHMSETRTTIDAQTLMLKAERRAKLTPKTVITDKLRSYLDAIEKAWGADIKHVATSPFIKDRKGDSTRAIERFHGTLKDRTKVMRALADKKSAKVILDGWLVHYNFFRPHTAHKGRTPAEAAGVKALYRSWKDVVKSKD